MLVQVTPSSVPVDKPQGKSEYLKTGWRAGSLDREGDGASDCTSGAAISRTRTCLPVDGAGGPNGVPVATQPGGMLSQVTLTEASAHLSTADLPPPGFDTFFGREITWLITPCFTPSFL